MRMYLLLSLLSLAASQPAPSCDDCVQEMEALGHLVTMGAHTIEVRSET